MKRERGLRIEREREEGERERENDGDRWILGGGEVQKERRREGERERGRPRGGRGSRACSKGSSTTPKKPTGIETDLVRRWGRVSCYLLSLGEGTQHEGDYRDYIHALILIGRTRMSTNAT